MLICETFEDIVQTMSDPSAYQALCQKVLPSLTGAFNVADVTSNSPLVVVSSRARVMTERGAYHFFVTVRSRVDDFTYTIRFGTATSWLRGGYVTQADTTANGE